MPPVSSSAWMEHMISGISCPTKNGDLDHHQSGAGPISETSIMEHIVSRSIFTSPLQTYLSLYYSKFQEYCEDLASQIALYRAITPHIHHVFQSPQLVSHLIVAMWWACLPKHNYLAGARPRKLT